MRISIEIDDALLAATREVSSQTTKKGMVDEALRLMVALRRQQQTDKAFGKYPWRGNLDKSR